MSDKQQHDPEICGCGSDAAWCPYNPNASELCSSALLDSTALDAIECAERVLSVCYTFYRHRSVWETAKGTEALEKIRKLLAVLSNSD